MLIVYGVGECALNVKQLITFIVDFGQKKIQIKGGGFGHCELT